MNPQKRTGKHAIVKQREERLNLIQEDAEAVYHAVVSETRFALFRCHPVILPGIG